MIVVEAGVDLLHARVLLEATVWGIVHIQVLLTVHDRVSCGLERTVRLEDLPIGGISSLIDSVLRSDLLLTEWGCASFGHSDVCIVIIALTVVVVH